MKLYSRLLMVLIITLLSIFMFASLVTARDDSSSRFMTKHGELTFVDAKGQVTDFHAVEIRLNGKVLLKSVPIEEHWNDGSLHYRQQYLDLANDSVFSNINSFQLSPNHKLGERPLWAERLLIAEGQGRSTTQMIILDFTGKEPFVSKRFIDNPDLKHLVTLERVKWGKKKAVFSLFGPYDCTYYYADKRVECDELVSE